MKASHDTLRLLTYLILPSARTHGHTYMTNTSLAADLRWARRPAGIAHRAAHITERLTGSRYRTEAAHPYWLSLR